MSHPTARLLVLTFPCFLVAARDASAQTIERISVSTSGEIANRFVETLTRPSEDGRYVAFTTIATNLVVPDPTLTRDVFLRDRVLGTTTRVRTDGIAADLTPDGRRISYYRALLGVASVLDIAADTEIALSTAPDVSSPGAFSADGRFVLYSEVVGAIGPDRVWRRELASGMDDLVSATFMGGPNTIVALPGFLSADGTIATFTTADPNIVPGDGNGKNDAFYKDYGFGFTDRISVSSFAAELPGDSSAGAVTPDTRYLLFSTESPAVPEDANGTWDLYVSDRFLGELRRASVSSSGESGNASSQNLRAWISNDGTRVIFDSLASNLVAGDTNGARDVFEHDFLTNSTRRIVLGVGGAQVDADVELRGISTDGRYLTVLSTASNLVPGAVNSEVQAYLIDLGPQCFVAEYCSAAPNSTGQTAAISSSGMPSFTSNSFVLSTVGLPAGSTCVFFHGTERTDPPTVFGDGLRCVGGTVKRLGMLNAVGDGAIQFQDLSALPYAGVQPGDVRRFQVMYRDAASTGAGFNTSAALEVTFCP
jgi:Tol biopolymer transport system component